MAVLGGLAVSYERGTPVDGGRARDPVAPSAVEPGGDDLKGFKYFRLKNGSSQGPNLALTGLFVPTFLDSGVQKAHRSDLPIGEGTVQQNNI